MRSFALPVLLSAVVLSACSATPAASPAASVTAATPAATAAAGGNFCDIARSNLEASKLLASNRQVAADTIAQVRRSNDAVLAAAPPEVREAVAASAKVTTALLDVLAANGGDLLKSAADPAVAAAAADAAKQGPALLDYLKTTCGIDVAAAVR